MLDLDFVNGFGPFTGQTWEIITFSQRNGDFQEIDVPLIGQATSLEVIHNSTNVLVNSLVTATDLAVAAANILVPTEAYAGEEFAIEYTVDNLSQTVADGPWIDSLYLSNDIELDASDQLLTRVEHPGDLAPLESYTNSVIATLPAAREGNYHVILVVDSRGQVPDVNRPNNRSHSVGVISTRVHPLEIGSTITRTIENGQDAYYRVDVPPGSEVRITADVEETFQAEFYASFLAVPDRSNFDVAATDPLALVHQLVLSGRSGPWYLLVHGRERANGERTFDLAAEEVGFELFGFSPTAGGNVGPVTLTLFGSSFTPDTTATLIAPDQSEYPAALQFFRSARELVTTFDAAGLAPGQYGVRVDQDGLSSIADATLEVFASDLPGQLEFFVSTTAKVLTRTGGQVMVYYRNTGDSDAPLLPVTISQSVATGFGQGIQFPVDSSILSQLAPALDATTPAVVPPGGSGVFVDTRFGTTTSAPPTKELVFTAKTPFVSFDQTVDWLSVRDQARPPLVPPEAWDIIFDHFLADVGTTFDELQTALSRAGQSLSLVGDDVTDINALMNFLFQQYDNALPNLTLDAAIDATAPGAGLQLVFSRAYQQAISSRFEAERTGTRFDAHNYDLRLWSEDTDGVLHPGYTDRDAHRMILVTPERVRVFQRQEVPVLFVPDVTEVQWMEVGSNDVIQPGGVLRLPSGTVLLFQGPGGRLSWIHDSNLNQITLHYTGERLTSIDHSNGESFALDYVDGRIVQLTDHVGRVTDYTYDAGGEHLAQVSGPVGTLSYTYLTGQGEAREHALASATYFDGTTVNYDYDVQGRLVQVAQSGGAEPLYVDYGQGEIILTDATGASVRLAFNSRPTRPPD